MRITEPKFNDTLLFLPDMNKCMKCPGNLYPNSNQDHCLSKIVTFLAYEDPMRRYFVCPHSCGSWDFYDE